MSLLIYATIIFIKFGNYTFLDLLPENGINYYRLQQIDLDGKTTDLGIRSVIFELSGVELSVYPNPTTNSINLSYAKGRFSDATLTDLTGKVLQTKVLRTNESSFTISLDAYAAGFYFIKLTGTNAVETRKVIKL